MSQHDDTTGAATTPVRDETPPRKLYYCTQCGLVVKESPYPPCCRDCRPAYKEAMKQARTMFNDSREFYVACDLYGGRNATYVLNLARFTRRLGLRVHHNQHRVRFRKDGAPMPTQDDRVDHCVLLRYSDDKEKFVLLSQPYDMTTTISGLYAGRAPYGFGTAAILYPCPYLYEKMVSQLAYGGQPLRDEDLPARDRDIWDPRFLELEER